MDTQRRKEMPYKDLEIRKEYQRNYNREWMRKDYAKNPEKRLAKEVKYRENNPKKRLLYSTRQSAKLKGLSHTITEDDLHLPDICPYLGIPIDYTAGNGKTMSKPSVDRIDSTKGYDNNNVEVMSSLANTMKSKATVEQLILFAKEILRRYDLPSV
jgi:hypothetical protein